MPSIHVFSFLFFCLEDSNGRSLEEYRIGPTKTHVLTFHDKKKKFVVL